MNDKQKQIAKDFWEEYFFNTTNNPDKDTFLYFCEDIASIPVEAKVMRFGGDTKYDVIYADPPWKYKNVSPPCLPEKQPDTCKIEYYYETMDLQDIKNMPIKNIANKNCVLFLWATTPAIREAFEVVDAWGFKYKTMITWEKTNRDCMGYWFRTCTEHLIVAIRGNVKAFRSMERTCYHEARTKHSQKPQYFYELIEKVTTGKRIELFARRAIEGWDNWGNEAPKHA